MNSKKKMKTAYRVSSFLLVLIIFLIPFSSCNRNEDPIPPPPEDSNMLFRISGIPELSSFLSLIQATGLDLLFNSPGARFTVFAPNNDAIMASGIRTDSTSLSDSVYVASLVPIVTYHFRSTIPVVAFQDLSDDPVIMVSDQGSAVRVQNVPAPLANDANVVEADLATKQVESALATNWLHIIDKVLIPPQDPLGDVIVASTSDSQLPFDSVVVSLERIENETGNSLIDLMNDTTRQFTLFAPTDQAFETYLVDNGFTSVSQVPIQQLEELLQYHIIPDKRLYRANFLSIDIVTRLEPTVLQNSEGETINLLFETNQANPFIDDTGILGQTVFSDNLNDLQASNGNYSGIDRVLLPGINLFAQLANDTTFSTLVAAIEKADTGPGNNYMSLFSDPLANITLFAPSNQAFISSSVDINNLTPAELGAMLDYHIIDGRFRTIDLGNNQVIETRLPGNFITIRRNGVLVFIEDNNDFNTNAQVQFPNRFSGNGILQPIDRVLLIN